MGGGEAAIEATDLAAVVTRYRLYPARRCCYGFGFVASGGCTVLKSPDLRHWSAANPKNGLGLAGFTAIRNDGNAVLLAGKVLDGWPARWDKMRRMTRGK